MGSSPRAKKSRNSRAKARPRSAARRLAEHAAHRSLQDGQGIDHSLAAVGQDRGGEVDHTDRDRFDRDPVFSLPEAPAEPAQHGQQTFVEAFEVLFSCSGMSCPRISSRRYLSNTVALNGASEWIKAGTEATATVAAAVHAGNELSAAEPAAPAGRA